MRASTKGAWHLGSERESSPQKSTIGPQEKRLKPMMKRFLRCAHEPCVKVIGYIMIYIQKRCVGDVPKSDWAIMMRHSNTPNCEWLTIIGPTVKMDGSSSSEAYMSPPASESSVGTLDISWSLQICRDSRIPKAFTDLEMCHQSVLGDEHSDRPSESVLHQ